MFQLASAPKPSSRSAGTGSLLAKFQLLRAGSPPGVTETTFGVFVMSIVLTAPFQLPYTVLGGSAAP
jgi:hypothetical protein